MPRDPRPSALNCQPRSLAKTWPGSGHLTGKDEFRADVIGIIENPCQAHRSTSACLYFPRYVHVQLLSLLRVLPTLGLVERMSDYLYHILELTAEQFRN